MKKIIKWVIDFWLDYASSSYNKLKKYDTDPEIDVLLNISFIQSLNLNLILILIFKFSNLVVKDFKYMIITTIVVFLFNYFNYKNLEDYKKQKIKSRVPKFHFLVYRIYAVISAVLLFFIAYCLR